MKVEGGLGSIEKVQWKSWGECDNMALKIIKFYHIHIRNTINKYISLSN